jgi:hypothetical protein
VAAVVEEDAGAGRRGAGDPERAADVGRLLDGVGHVALGRTGLAAFEQIEVGDVELGGDALAEVA